MIEIHTDGACSGNPGPGGWAAIVVENGEKRELYGRESLTTNNRMEMLAVIKGLQATLGGVDVKIYSDSQYVINTMTRNWKRRANQDLWGEMDSEVIKRNVEWQWEKGHVGNPLNEMADFLANRESKLQANDSSGGSLTHFDGSGKARMIDVGAKSKTNRTAIARGSVLMLPETIELIKSNGLEKGDSLAVARVSGIMAAKNTFQLIPLCHPIALEHISLEFEFDEDGKAIHITATAKTTSKTGVEMEALTAVGVAALTIYDMCKSVDKGMCISEVRLLSKKGGKSGDFILDN